MSTKATKVNVTANNATRSQMAQEATQAANEAAAASQRASQCARVVRRAAMLAAQAASAARDAQQAAREAHEAELVANQAAKVARSSAAGAVRAARESDDEVLSAAVDRSARYLVTYNGQLVATFLNEDDAVLFESELADLDQSHGVSSAKCEVLVRRGGRRVSGFMITAGKLFSFLRDDATSSGEAARE